MIRERGSAASGARIVDRGYQHYTGERRGPGSAIWAIAVGTMKRSLGFKRSTGAKILPFLLIAGAMIPGTVVIGVRVLFGNNIFSKTISADRVLPYNGYFGLIATIMLVFAAIAAPEALCPDRRQRVLSLYYASPLSPLLYLAAQALAVFGVLLLVTLLPVFLLWVANVGLADDPAMYFKDHAHYAVQIVASGCVIAAFNALLGLAVASFTDRRGYAAGALIGGSLALSVVDGVIRGALRNNDWSRYAALIDPFLIPSRVAAWILGNRVQPDIGGPLFLLTAVVIGGIAGLLVVRTYRSISF